MNHMKGNELRWLRILLLVALAVPCHTHGDSPALNETWPNWRGPLSNGTSPSARPPIRWSESENVRWKIQLPGAGHSSPIVWGHRVFVLTAAPIGEAKPAVHDSAPGVHDSVPVTHVHEFRVTALNRTNGATLWSKVVCEEWPHEGGHTTGSQASASPVTDGERIYAFFGSRGLYCLDFNGTVLWTNHLGKMSTHHAHGEGSSPVLHRELLIVNWDQEGDCFIRAFHKVTGREVWKTKRDEKTSWSTPLVIECDGKSQVVVAATKRVRGYDVDTGHEIWQCAGLTDNVVASPIYHKGMLVTGNSYYVQAMMGIRVSGARGDVTGSEHVAWKLGRLTPYVPSPILYGDRMYFVRHNQNVLSRLDPQTGQFLGEPLRLEGIRDFIFSTPVGAGGHIYVTGRDGSTVVLRHDEKNEIVSLNQLKDSFSATAAVAGSEIFLRGERFLYCVAAP